MTWLFVLIVIYIILTALCICYAWLDIKPLNKVMEWQCTTTHEIDVWKERNLELEKQIKELREFRKTFEAIESEPDFHIRKGGR